MIAKRPTPDPGELVEAAVGGSTRAIGQLLSLVEGFADELPDVMRMLPRASDHAHIVGLTGPAGVGKSTATSALIGAWRSRGQRVAVLAIDPSSPFSSGALLGDRIRMQEHASDDGVYIRSMASRGRLGGLAAGAPQALRVLAAVGFDVILVETVGVGQSEVDIAALADTTVVIVAPGMGDGIQAVKAGVLEIADVFVVNKSDRDGAGQTARELRHMLEITASGPGGDWRTPVLSTVATTGEGVDAVVEALVDHRRWLESGGEWARRRVDRAANEIERIAESRALRRLERLRAGALLRRLAAEVADGTLDPYAAADRFERPDGDELRRT